MLWGLGEWLYPKDGRAYQAIVPYIEADTSADTCVYGTSTMFYGFVPYYSDHLTGTKCALMATAAQSPQQSWYVFSAYLAEGKTPKTVILNLAYNTLFSHTYTGRVSAIVENLPVTNPVKYQMIADTGFELEEMPELFLKALVSREYLSTRLKELFTGKDDSISAEGLDEELRQYLGGGYNYTESVNYRCGATPYMSAEDFDETSLMYFEKIINTCRERGIEVILISMPHSPGAVLLTNAERGGTYQEQHDAYVALAEKYGLPYWDLNYSRQEVLEITPENFTAAAHANATLAFRETALLAELVQKYQAGTLVESEYFYDTYEEYVALHQGVNGLVVSTAIQTAKETGEHYLKMQTISTSGAPEWRAFYKAKKSADWEPLTDWNAEGRISLPQEILTGSKIYIRIEMRSGSSGEAEMVYEKNYSVK